METCRICNELKVKMLSKTYRDGSMRYVDALDKGWEGRVCPDCVRKVRRERRERKLGKISRKYK